ncbi:uncharacterized protein [Montipora foliosa]|uniref:uncharacterized protein n=1 Tax=Montipora foliosa TaxID=591990 RepID=UPI0035F1EB1B
MVAMSFLTSIQKKNCFSDVALDPQTVEVFVNEVHDLYFLAKNSIEDPNVSNERLSGLKIKLEAAIQHLRRIHWTLETSRPCSEPTLQMLVTNLLSLEGILGRMIEQYSCLIPFLAEHLCYRAPLSATRSIGRPSYIITKEQLEVMRAYALSWMDIAKALGVSISTIWRRRVYFSMGRQHQRGRRTLISAELREVVEEIKSRSMDAGIIMIEGELAARNLYASRSDISDALISVDPVGANLRWRNLTPRVTYSVPAPNSLWHLDGNHKLIRWRLVVHGGIDGYSRLVVYLKCSDNNRAATVASLFVSATEEFCWPSRIRIDKGVENGEVKRLMLQRRGEGRGSVLQGSSVHNQRIERLWRDMRKMVTEYFRRLFYFLENQALLDATSEIDLAALHLVFIPRINNSLRNFKASWNNHKLSTENQKTPNQLYILGMLRMFGSNHSAVRDFFEENIVAENYGVSEPEIADAILPERNEVVVPVNAVSLSGECLVELQRLVDPHSHDGNHGISMYIQARDIINRHHSP